MPDNMRRIGIRRGTYSRSRRRFEVQKNNEINHRQTKTRYDNTFTFGGHSECIELDKDYVTDDDISSRLSL
jgi:hypothetical protein